MMQSIWSRAWHFVSVQYDPYCHFKGQHPDPLRMKVQVDGSGQRWGLKSHQWHLRWTVYSWKALGIRHRTQLPGEAVGRGSCLGPCAHSLSFLGHKVATPTRDRGWDGWMASSTQWTWVWASSGTEQLNNNNFYKGSSWNEIHRKYTQKKMQAPNVSDPTLRHSDKM